MMKQFDSRSSVLKTMASSEYEEDSDLEGDEDSDLEEDEDSDLEEDEDSDLEEDEDSDSEEDEDSDSEEDEYDDNHSWEEAIKHNSVFYGDNVIIALVCKEKTCPHCGSRLIKRIKWKIATRKGNRWTVMEEHPFNCDVDEVFSEYGLPSEFTPISGYYRDDEAIIPCKRR